MWYNRRMKNIVRMEPVPWGHHKVIIDRRTTPLCPAVEFGTIRTEPVKRFTSDREALPIRGEAQIRKDRGLSIFKK